MDGVFCLREIASTVHNPVKNDVSIENRISRLFKSRQGWQAGRTTQPHTVGLAGRWWLAGR